MVRLFLTVICLNLVLTMPMDAQEIERGVSFELATNRKAQITNVEYDLELKLEPTDPIAATMTVRFDLAKTNAPVVLDFNAQRKNIESVLLTPQLAYSAGTAKHEIKNGHIIIPVSDFKPGKFKVSIKFTAGNQSLNRNDKFLYTLLVPDRASTVFPCFDQPDIKAKFRLKLDLPQGWSASANGAIESQQPSEGQRQSLSFKQTKPISTYLFAFAAGEFQSITREIEGRSVTMFHRESDKEKVERNVDDIFKIHSLAIDWMQDYTKIDYPFDKFDFVLIPSFQYGGMEHIGNIFYNADQLFLEESATKDQKLNRASLIAHETAHMWFGNLVTMKWFDDVWLKEVFANFMAAKIVHPRFPKINHDLGFMLKHHPRAYGEDRSGGTYPIQQKLDNLRNAGTLYGRIIYQKAPIVMRQLETMIGQRQMQKGLQEYLEKFSYDNAVWDDLIEILDRDSKIDLKQWSAAWVKEPGTPEVDSKLTDNAKTETKFLTIRQTRTTPSDKFWSQQVDIKLYADGKVAYETRTMIEGKTTDIELPKNVQNYDFYLANGSELGYGYFRLDQKSKNWLLKNVQTIADDVTRGAAWLALYESLVRGTKTEEIEPRSYLKTLIAGVASEAEPLNRQNILSQLSTVYWKFIEPADRAKFAPEIEKTLWTWIDDDKCESDAKSAYYKSLVNIGSTDETVKRLFKIWESESEVNGLPLAESDFMTLAYELALRMPDKSDEIMRLQLDRMKNEDRKNRFAFVTPALSANQSTRDAFFESLKDAKNRRPERWTLEGLKYLHHPLRAAVSEKYLLPSLELLEEIQSTGDIFFPKRWLVETFSGHRTSSAASVVEDFLKDRPDYSYRLKNKILQAADLLLKIRK